MTAFEKAFAHTVGLEGKYSNNPADSGGETMFGITLRVARVWGYTGEMKDLPLSLAMQIYREDYWDKVRGNDLAALSEAVATEVFDTAVNMSPSVAGMFLQRSLNVLNNRATFYGDIEVDGAIGRLTVAAFRDFMARRGLTGERVMLRALNALQGSRYIELAEKREKDETFVFGWLSNRVRFT